MKKMEPSYARMEMEHGAHHTLKTDCVLSLLSRGR
jgi:hypothetical protein